MKLIDKDALVAEIERLKENTNKRGAIGKVNTIVLCNELLSFLDTFEVKEVDEQKERMSECPYRQVGCTMYEGYVLECTGACSWVVDYPKLKELKAQKGK